MGAAARETGALRATVEQLRAELQRLAAQLASAQERLDWWPRPLTKLVDKTQ